MARGSTGWHADTCDCVIEFFNDDGSYKATIAACDKHAELANTPAHLDAVRAHNIKRNLVLNEILDALPVLVDEANMAITYGIPIAYELFVGYDRAAPKDDDPVIVRGISRLILKLGLRKGNQALTRQDVIDHVAGKFQGVRIEE